MDVADAEVLNNLGFAYYVLGKQKNDTRYYSYSYGPTDNKMWLLQPTYYEQAEHYLQEALQIEPKRWSALLNMGDLEYDLNHFTWAIKRYEELLKVKPDYKFGDTIRQRITELKRQPEKIGVELVVTKYRSGKNGITYTRVDDKNVICRGYYETGQMRFQENIVDGYENGEYKSWFDNGHLSVVGQQKNGDGIGKYIYYNYDGSIHQVVIYKEDGTSVDVTKDYVK